MNRQDFQILADEIIEDAKILIDGGRFAAAYYVAGYAVECALKASISSLTQQHDFPARKSDRLYTHDLKELLKFTGQNEPDSAAQSDIASNWNIVQDWNEQSRYSRQNQAKADSLYEAITHAQDGVLPWIKTFW